MSRVWLHLNSWAVVSFGPDDQGFRKIYLKDSLQGLREIYVNDPEFEISMSHVND